MPLLKQTLHDESSCCMVKVPCAHLPALRRRLQTRGQEGMAATRAKVQEFAEQSASLEQDVKQREAHIKALQVSPPAHREGLCVTVGYQIAQCCCTGCVSLVSASATCCTLRCVSGSLSSCHLAPLQLCSLCFRQIAGLSSTAQQPETHPASACTHTSSDLEACTGSSLTLKHLSMHVVCTTTKQNFFPLACSVRRRHRAAGK